MEVEGCQLRDIYAKEICRSLKLPLANVMTLLRYLERLVGTVKLIAWENKRKGMERKVLRLDNGKANKLLPRAGYYR